MRQLIAILVQYCMPSKTVQYGTARTHPFFTDHSKKQQERNVAVFAAHNHRLREYELPLALYLLLC
jgi:hypothetical protein